MLNGLLFEFCACHKWKQLYNVSTARLTLLFSSYSLKHITVVVLLQ